MNSVCSVYYIQARERERGGGGLYPLCLSSAGAEPPPSSVPSPQAHPQFTAFFFVVALGLVSPSQHLSVVIFISKGLRGTERKKGKC